MTVAKSNDDNAQEQINAESPTYYANSVAFAVSPFDITFAFGQRTGDTAIQPQVRVIMSLEHALVMLLVARRALREHTSNTGIAIPLPKSVMRDLQLDEESPLW